MASFDRERTHVYVVYWADRGIVKAGRTVRPARVKKFIARGAEIVALIPNVTDKVEAAILALLGSYGHRAFDSWRSGVDLLGAGGIGFSECYTLTPAVAEQFFEEVCRAYPQYEA